MITSHVAFFRRSSIGRNFSGFAAHLIDRADSGTAREHFSLALDLFPNGVLESSGAVQHLQAKIHRI